MNEFRNRKPNDFERPFPGCMGGMVNLFDLSAGMSGNKLLMEKAHRDGSLVPRNRVEVGKKVPNPIGDRVEDRPMSSDLRRTTSNKKSIGTPMKMLIAQEMSKETEPKCKPSVVARLMGLDALPAQQSISTAQRSRPEGYLRNTSLQSGTTPRYRQQENGFADEQIPCENDLSWSYAQKQKEYKDVYEVWKQSSKTNYMKDQQRQKERSNETADEKKMALVRQKFIEAKRLATDEKLRQSKEFQDALEVLSSNRDLFLKFLQEPNSLFSKHLFEFQSIPPQTKHIAVLKPAKAEEMKGFSGRETMSGKQIKKRQQMVETNGRGKNRPSRGPGFLSPSKADDSSHPTRIVVLKPSPGKTQDIKAVVSSPTSSPRPLHARDFYEDSQTDGAQGFREVAKDITWHMQESLSSSHRDRDRVLPSSLLSNGYSRDESSFNRSLENEYLEEGNLSDSEAITPTSRHSWDYINRLSSPYSSSSFSRASYSSESSVSREAKKRLSERWAMVTSSGRSQEQRPVVRSSSTLGEVLALPEKAKPVSSKEEAMDGALTVSSSRSWGGEQDKKGPPTRFLSSSKGEGVEEDSPRNLSRSRSVPVSSTVYEKVVLDADAPDAKVGESVVTNELVKSKRGKSSFKGKVSSLFFSRNKKGNKEKSSPAPSVGSRDEFQSATTKMPGNIVPEINKLSIERSDDISGCVTSGHLEEGTLLNLGGLSRKTSHPTSIWMAPKQDTFSAEGALTRAKSETPESSSESLDQPSPISVLEAPFEDEVNTPVLSKSVKAHLQEPTANMLVNSEQTTQSPLESVTRSLSWDGAVLQTPIPNPPEQSAVSSKEDNEELEWFSFIQTILSATGLDQTSDVVLAKWHSPESLLDPSFVDRWIDDSKCKQWNLNRRLLFDCINTALVDIASCGGHKGVPVGSTVIDKVWGQVREWFPYNASQFSNEMEHRMLVESVVRKEVCGRGWVDLMEREVDGIGKEIEAEVLEKLVEEALAELTCGLN